MNILLISSTSPFESIGGTERYLLNFMKYCEQNTSFNLIMMLPTSEPRESEVHGSASIIFSQNLDISPSKPIQKLVNEFSEEVNQVIGSYAVDIICAENFHIGLPTAYSLKLNVVAGLKHIPVVLRLHSFSISQLQSEMVNQLDWKSISCVSRSVAGD